jgi:hypothetical protein
MYHSYLALAEIYRCFDSGGTQQAPPPHSTPRRQIEHATTSSLVESSGKSLHPRRTLDQFYYSSLADTRFRDRTQTISKWTGPGVGSEGRGSAANESLIGMVEQLWCWVLDSSTSQSFAGCCHMPHIFHRYYHHLLSFRRRTSTCTKPASGRSLRKHRVTAALL